MTNTENAPKDPVFTKEQVEKLRENGVRVTLEYQLPEDATDPATYSTIHVFNAEYPK